MCTKQKRGTPIVRIANGFSLFQKCENDVFSFFLPPPQKKCPQRDIGLQERVLNWIIEILDERPKRSMDYDHWIQDGTILVKGVTFFKKTIKPCHFPQK